MRDIDPELAESLASGVTTLAFVWRFTRLDGAIFAFTDHDRPLNFDALVCEPVEGLAPGAIEKSVGLGVDSASIAGALSSDAITEEDIARGLWDGARVEIFRVDWRTPALRLHLFAGRIGEVRRGVSGFEAELRGLQAPFNVPVGRVFSRYCDADVGDARCGKDVETSVHRGEGEVSALLGGRGFRASGLDAFADDWFARGRVVWLSGAQSEVAAHRSGDAGAQIELLDHPGPALVVGAAFTIYAGCDKRIETCRAKFANVLNFRGFPHMPGNDVLQAGPVAGDRFDGGSRQT
jgi:uncharacterized phage protein (TIGR02218 family)